MSDDGKKEDLYDVIQSRRNKEAEEKQDELLTYVKELGDENLEARKEFKEGFRELDKKVAGFHDEVTGEIKDFREQHEADVKMICERQAEHERKVNSKIDLGNHGFSKAEKALQAIPEDERHKVAQEEAHGNEQYLTEDMQLAPVRVLATRWWALAAKAQMPAKFKNNRAIQEELEKCEKALTDIARQKASWSETTDSIGGYAVPDIVGREILRKALGFNKVVNAVRKVPMTSDTLKLPNEATGVTAYWGADHETLTQGEGTLGETVLSAQRLSGRATASIELIEDANVGIMAYFRDAFAEKIGRELDEAILEGASGSGDFTGVVTETGVNSVTTTTTDGEDVVYQDLVNAYAGSAESAYIDQGVWFMHPKQWAKVLGLVDSNGQPIVRLGMVQAGPPMSLMGRPVILTSAISVNVTRGSTGSTSNIYYGPPEKLYLGVRNGLRFDVTDQVNWASYAMDMRVVGRFGFAVAVPGAWTKLVGGTVD